MIFKAVVLFSFLSLQCSVCGAAAPPTDRNELNHNISITSSIGSTPIDQHQSSSSVAQIVTESSRNNNWTNNMIAAVTSLISAIAALVAIFYGPTLNSKSEERRLISSMRKQWIEDVRTDVAKIAECAGWFYREGMDKHKDSFANPSEHRKFYNEKTQELIFLQHHLELLLIPVTSSFEKLNTCVETVRIAAWEEQRSSEFVSAMKEMMNCCKQIIDTEWKKISRA